MVFQGHDYGVTNHDGSVTILFTPFIQYGLKVIYRKTIAQGCS